MRALVIEDYAPVRNAITQALREEGISTDEAGDGACGLSTATSTPYDLIVLDLMLPEMGGLQVLKNLRKNRNQAQILILTARDTVEDRVAGLDLGADDYLAKPFAMEELLARVRALLRRAYDKKTPTIELGHLHINTTAHEVHVAGEPVDFTAREYALLEYLAMRAGEVVSRNDIWNHIYDEAADSTSNVVDVYIGYLRKKIERPYHRKLLHTRRGEGYVLTRGNE